MQEEITIYCLLINILRMWQTSNALQNEVTSKKKLRAYIIISWNSYYFIQNIFSSRFLYKNLKIELYKTIILLVPHGCETWSVVLSEELRLKVTEQGSEENICT
jgi:hypothetical protein